MTAKENTDHAYQKELKNNNTLASNGLKNAKKILQLDKKTNRVVKVWDSISQIKRELNFDKGAIHKYCNHLKKSYKGFYWEYENGL